MDAEIKVVDLAIKTAEARLETTPKYTGTVQLRVTYPETWGNIDPAIKFSSVGVEDGICEALEAVKRYAQELAAAAEAAIKIYQRRM